MPKTQRIIKWTEDYQHAWSVRSEVNRYDGVASWLDVDEAMPPFLLEAFTKDGQVGRASQHSRRFSGGHYIWTFVVEFD